MLYLQPKPQHMEHGNIDMDVVHRWDESSLQLLYRHFYKALVAFAHQMVGSVGVAEELVQDAFIRLWQRRNEFESQGSLRAYLYHSVRNACISHLRHERVERSRIESFQLDYRLSSGDDDETYREELIRQLLLSIDTLPPKQREVFLLSVKGKSCEEIAAEMNITPESVKKQRQRGIRRLRDTFTPEMLLLLIMMMK